jgi:hypothetical protein
MSDDWVDDEKLSFDEALARFNGLSPGPVETWSAATTQFIAAARTAWPAAERECEQLRAEAAELRTELGQVKAATRFADLVTIVAERDETLALLHKLRNEVQMVQESEVVFLHGSDAFVFGAGFNDAVNRMHLILDESGLLDGGQQHGN